MSLTYTISDYIFFQGSVQTYTKTHVLANQRQRMAQAQLQRGRDLFSAGVTVTASDGRKVEKSGCCSSG